jgi:hypothetical protein
MVKHFVDIVQGSRYPVLKTVSLVYEVTAFIFQIDICDIGCSENNILFSPSEDHPSAIPADCTFHIYE